MLEQPATDHIAAAWWNNPSPNSAHLVARELGLSFREVYRAVIATARESDTLLKLWVGGEADAAQLQRLLVLLDLFPGRAPVLLAEAVRTAAQTLLAPAHLQSDAHARAPGTEQSSSSGTVL